MCREEMIPQSMFLDAQKKFNRKHDKVKVISMQSRWSGAGMALWTHEYWPMLVDFRFEIGHLPNCPANRPSTYVLTVDESDLFVFSDTKLDMVWWLEHKVKNGILGYYDL